MAESKPSGPNVPGFYSLQVTVHDLKLIDRGNDKRTLIFWVFGGTQKNIFLSDKSEILRTSQDYDSILDKKAKNIKHNVNGMMNL